VRLEGLGKLKRKINDLIVTRTRNLPACRIEPTKIICLTNANDTNEVFLLLNCVHNLVLSLGITINHHLCHQPVLALAAAIQTSGNAAVATGHEQQSPCTIERALYKTPT
jgi:hypothetical protein